MTAPDRTDELLRAMLERRAGEPAPAWLLDRTMHEVTIAGRPRGGNARLTWMQWGARGRLSLVAALVAMLLLLVGGALVVAGVIDLPPGPEATAPALIVLPSASPSESSPVPGGSPVVEPTPRPSLAPPPTARPVPDSLLPDTLAVVTRDGFDLRVRSAPGTDRAQSKELEPLLGSGTRMLIVSGPVPANGYDWYEVLVDPDHENLYGWVAAAGKDGVAWIEPAAPSCPDVLDEKSLVDINRLDYLVCYGDAEVEVSASRIEPQQGDDALCFAVGLDVCTVEPAWMNAQVWLGLDVGGGETSGLMSVAPPDLYSRAAGVPRNTPVVLTLAADQPEARDCRFVDAAGDDLIPPGRAALACRMQFVIRDLAWDEPSGDPGVGTDPVPEPPAADTMAAVNVDYLQAWSAPSGEPGARPLYVLNREQNVYVDAGPRETDAGAWYAILPEDPRAGPYGWVLVSGVGEQALRPLQIECPAPDDWATFNELPAVWRLVCSDGAQVTVNVVLKAYPEPQPTSAFACMARPYAVDLAPCLATPQWLASPTGVDATGPGSISYPAVDPASMAQSDLPPTPTLMRVTGRYEHPDSAGCRVTNPAAGEQLMDPAEAAIYCRARFVIQAAEPVR